MGKALADIVDGLQRWELWTTLAWNDVQRRYRRSFFGPLWSTLSTAIFVVFLGPLYSQVMGIPVSVYVPHLLTGLIIWTFISNVILEGCKEFVHSEVFIKSVKLPYSTFFYRNLWRNAIVFAYQVPVFVAAAIILQIELTPYCLLFPLGLVLVVLNAMGLGALASIISTRYRDVNEILSSLLRIMFFLTPILWHPSHSKRFQIVADLNPFYHLVEVIRSPLTTGEFRLINWVAALATGLISCGVALLYFSRFRTRIPFWL